MSYVDGFVLPVKTERLKEYMAMAKKCAKIWKEHGALGYKECVADDIDMEGFGSYTKATKAKPDETVVFAFIVYKSRADRDKVNKKVMADPRLNALCDEKDMPFDCKKMIYGGFKTLVEF